MAKLRSSEPQPRVIELEADYAFRPTYEPLSTWTSDQVPLPTRIRAGLLDGTLALVLRRNITPNRWFVTDKPALRPGDVWPLEATKLMLDHAPTAALLEPVAHSGARVDYGAAMQAYIPMAFTNTFADQGKPQWELFRLNPVQVAKELQRRERVASRAVTTKLWMYRSLAAPVLELLRSGHGHVSADGYFTLDATTASRERVYAAVQARAIQLRFAKPAHIERREEQYFNNPRHRFSGFRGKRPPRLAHANY